MKYSSRRHFESGYKIQEIVYLPKGGSGLSSIDMNECDLHSTSEKVTRVLLMRIIGLCFTSAAEYSETRRTANRKPACQSASLSRHPLNLLGIICRDVSRLTQEIEQSRMYKSNGYKKRETVRLGGP